MARLREELAESKAATAEMQGLHAAQQQAWQRDTISLKAENDKQVSKD